jgi:hypothetical protein
VTIDGSQNVGVGVTPKAYTVGKAIEVGGAGNALWGVGSGNPYLTANTYFDGNYRYATTQPASYYVQNTGAHSWAIAPSGTAGTVATFTTAMTLNASGNLGINTTSPNVSGQGTDVRVVTISGASNFWGGVELNNPLTSGGSLLGFIGWTGSNMTAGYNMPAYIGTWLASGTALKQGGELRFHTQSDNTAGSVERMRIDSSGNLLVGYTGASIDVNGFSVSPSNKQIAIFHATGTSSGVNFANFLYGGGGIGSITQNGTTGVLYNLTSDYRLKNNPVPVTGAKDFIMALKPKKWQWWDGSGEGVGFIAHEFMEVAKYSGHGEKDAVETIEIKDEDGNVTGTEERPVYQSIQPSSSEVMANLVSLIQEQQAIIQAQAADIAALKAKVGI